MLSEPLRVVAEIASVLEALNVPYLVGGSLASSMYGVPRSTQDVDVVARLLPEHSDDFVNRLDAAFHIDPEMVANAIRDFGSFNIIHRRGFYKADFFVPDVDEWIDVELTRAREETLDLDGTEQIVRFASPEDVVLHKLVWYRMGSEVSERQLEDVRGLLRVQGAALDQAYLNRWSSHLRVDDLLRTLREGRP